jgi:hypothetical protein
MGNSNWGNRSSWDYQFTRTIDDQTWSNANFHFRNYQMLCRISIYARVHYSTQRWFVIRKEIIATNKVYPVATYLADFLDDMDKVTKVNLAMNSKFREWTIRLIYGRLYDGEYAGQLNPTLPFPDKLIPF